LQANHLLITKVLARGLSMMHESLQDELALVLGLSFSNQLSYLENQ